MPAKKTKEQGKNGTYYLINPAGGIHSVTKQHAEQRLRNVGWRLATEDEIAIYLTPAPENAPARGLKPVAPRWSSDPDAQIVDLPEPEEA